MGISGFTKNGLGQTSAQFQVTRRPFGKGRNIELIEKVFGYGPLHICGLDHERLVADSGEMAFFITHSAFLSTHSQCATFAVIFGSQRLQHGPQASGPIRHFQRITYGSPTSYSSRQFNAHCFCSVVVSGPHGIFGDPALLLIVETNFQPVFIFVGDGNQSAFV